MKSAPIRTKIAPLTLLARILPSPLQNLSISRAQIAMDQLRGTLEDKRLDNVVLATAALASTPEDPLAAAIAIHHLGPDGRTGDMATILHAGSVEPSVAGGSPATIAALSATLDGELHRRGVRFVQWATDAHDRADDSVSRWCQASGFQAVGTLDYLSALLPSNSEPIEREIGPARLRFESMEWDRPGELQRFADLVERTYAGTLDCPGLARHRTTLQTLTGYQAAGAFDPALWFRALDDQGGAVGCLVLARHRPVVDSDRQASSIVIEIVYMGLAPEARGKGNGGHLVRHALHAAMGLGAERLILGVDQQNQPALAVYRAAGLEAMMSETVWVKSLGRADA